MGAISSELKVEEEITLEQPHGYLIRCDAVNFPLNCQIYDHTHAGPGIRCLHCGKLTLDIEGERHVPLGRTTLGSNRARFVDFWQLVEGKDDRDS